MNRKWYDIRNQTADSAEIFLYDEIGGWGITAADFVRDLRSLSGKAVTLRVHSPGGSVLDGHAIYNALLRHAGGVTVQIDGLAASMAGVIAMSGKPVRMAENAFLMIHNPSGAVFGGAEEMRKQADLIDKMRDGLVNVFVQKTGKSADVIEAMMEEETWFTAQEAKDYGLIDEITDKLDIAAKFDALAKFKHTPRALVDTNAKPMATQTLDTITAELAAAIEQRNAAIAQAQTNFTNFTALNEKHTALVASFEKAQADLSAATEANATLNAELDAARKTSAEALNAEVARVLAASGHAPVALGSDKPTASQASATLTEQLEAIKDPIARTAFYRAHKAAIFAEKTSKK